jgi:TP901 family phage tail tape measure protein
MALVGGKAGLMIRVGAAIAPFKKGMSQIKGSVRGLGRSLAHPFKIASIAAGGFLAVMGTVITTLAVKGVMAAAKFEHAFAEVKTIVDKTTWGLSKAQYDISKMARDIGANLIDVTKGLYQTISAGFTEQAEAMRVLETSVKAGIAGLTSTEVAVDAITTGLSAYQMSGFAAEEISDKLFTTIRLGKLRFEELSGSLGRILPVASAFGVSIDEVLGGLASLTLQGMKTDEAVTGLRALLLSIAKPSEQAAQYAERLGISLGVTALQSKGLVGVLKDIKRATGGGADAMINLVDNVRALNAALGLGGDNLKTLETNIYDVTWSFGATQEAFDVMDDTLSHQWARFWENMSQAVMTFGERFRPGIKGFLGGAADEIGKWLDTLDIQYSYAAWNSEQAGEEIGRSFAKAAIAWFEKLIEYGDKVVTWITDNKDSIVRGFEAIATVIGALADVIDAVGAAYRGAKDALEWLSKTFMPRRATKIPSPFRSDIIPPGEPYQRGGYVGARGGSVEQGEYVMTRQETSMWRPLLDFLHGYRQPAMAGADHSQYSFHMNFTGAVDRDTIRNQIVPEVQRAYEIGGFKRERGLRG